MPYRTRAGTELELLSAGTRSADQMIAAELQANALVKWLLRALGYFLMWVSHRSSIDMCRAAQIS